jgi:ABC-type nitrate/sulfonate/bicarbonate transport system substrate-binding protein
MSRRIPKAAALSALGSSATRTSWLALALAASPGVAGAADKLVLQLHRPAQFEFAGYYAALWQGFYRESGLEVAISPGAPAGHPLIDPVREIVEGRAQFGTGTVQLLVRAAQGQSLLLLAPIFQQSDVRVYYRANGDLSSPGALLSGRVGRPPPSNVLDLELRTALRAEAVDPEKLRSLPTEPAQALADLASHRVDAFVGSAWELPWQARERGVVLKSFNPAGYRVEYYGDSLFTLQRLAQTDPGMVERFREASVRGWQYAFQHPDEIAARILSELPAPAAVADPAGFTRYQTELARELARYPEVPLGHSNPDRWGRIQQGLIAIGEITRPADLDAFLYNPDTVDRRRGEGSVAIAALAAVVVLLAGAGLLWRRGLGRSTAPAGATVRGGDGQPPEPPGGVALPTGSAPAGMRRGLASFGADVRNRLSKLGQMSLWPRLALLAASASARVEHLKIMTRGVVRAGAPGPRATDLNAMLTRLEPSIRRCVPDTVGCRLSLLPDPWLCHADPDAVAATTLDLVAAAVADMPAGGDLILGTRQYAIDEAAAVELAGSTPGNYVRLTVRDNGPGLSAERIGRIYDRAATARPAVAAAADLARRLGGFARVESAEGVGTAVHLYFRRAVAADLEARWPAEDDEAAKAAAA